MKQGVPQGGVISPILFNYYLSKIPVPPEGIELVSYADDCSILCSDPDIDSICDRLNPYLETLKNWFLGRKLELSSEKSTATIFTTWTKEVNTTLNIKIDNSVIPTVKHPKILGLTLNNMATFNEHVKIIRSKVQKRNNILKALAGSSWGKDKENGPNHIQSSRKICPKLCGSNMDPTGCNHQLEEAADCAEYSIANRYRLSSHVQ